MINWINENGGTVIMMALMFGPLYLMCWAASRQDFAKSSVKKADVIETREIGFDEIPESVRNRLNKSGEKK